MSESTLTVSPRFSDRAFRDALGNYASGVTIITASHNQELFGFTCQSFFSLSVDPPLVAFSVMAKSTSYPKVREARSFAINVLAADQINLSNQFARSGTDKWAGVSWAPSELGSPVLDNSVLTLDCTPYREYEGGDHTLVVARVEDIKVNDGASPLLFFQGKYAQIGQSPQH
jgi:3-hydroxy-9,10-secoandrosta-1,3,5(10)-triene-9,17-dione monooxygenase reductase component